MSFEIRKFYEDQPAIAVGPPDIAAIIAKQGVKIDEFDDPASVPDIKIKQEPQIVPAQPAASTETVTAPVAPPETAKAPATTPAPSEPPKPVQQQPAPAQPSDWKQDIKKADTKEVLKELGFDEKMVGFFSKWKSSGDVKEYLEAMSVDYTKMSAEDVMRRYLQNEYPGLEPADFEELFQMKIVDQYKLNPDQYSETEVKRGKILLNADAKKIREQFTAKQQELILSQPPQAEDPEQKWVEAQKQEIEKYKNVLGQDPATKNLLTAKKLVIGEGEEAFNLEISEPEKIISALNDPSEWASLIFNEDGSPKVSKQLLLSAIANDTDGNLFKAMTAHYKSLGAKNAIDPIENASQPVGTPTNQPPPKETPASAMAKQGVMTSGE